MFSEKKNFSVTHFSPRMRIFSKFLCIKSLTSSTWSWIFIIWETFFSLEKKSWKIQFFHCDKNVTILSFITGAKRSLNCSVLPFSGRSTNASCQYVSVQSVNSLFQYPKSTLNFVEKCVSVSEGDCFFAHAHINQSTFHNWVKIIRILSC